MPIPYKDRNHREMPIKDFIRWVIRQKRDHCIPWPFAKNPLGYGKVHFRGAQRSAARVVLTVAKGDPPHPGMDCAHAPVICHNPACVNVRHLRWATRRENSRDREIDGTHRPQRGPGAPGAPRAKSDGPVGVSYVKGRSRWRAYAYVYVGEKKKQVHLGWHQGLSDARAARAAWDANHTT